MLDTNQVEKLKSMCDTMRTKINTIDVILSAKFPILSAKLRAARSRVIELRRQITELESIQTHKELRNLYKRVANRTHPDKDGGDSETFAAARKAYEEGDVLELSKIANSVGLANKPSEELLAFQAQSLMWEYNALKQHPLLAVSDMYSIGTVYYQMQAEKLYEGYLNDTIFKFEAEAKELEAQLSKASVQSGDSDDLGQERLPQPFALLPTDPIFASA